MHLKNMALLKIAEPVDQGFHSVHMAPLYDAVTTRGFPNLKHDRMALKLNGRDDNLRRADFLALATNAGLKVAEADDAIDSVLHNMKAAVDRINLPDKIARTVDANKVVANMLEICRNRIHVNYPSSMRPQRSAADNRRAKALRALREAFNEVAADHRFGEPV
jgi:serine/threonine-protein kinase HipA